MDLSVVVETKTLPIAKRHKRIFDKFRERSLFPLVRVVRLIEEAREIITIYTANMETTEDGGNQMVARQVEIIRIPEAQPKPLSAA